MTLNNLPDFSGSYYPWLKREIVVSLLCSPSPKFMEYIIVIVPYNSSNKHFRIYPKGSGVTRATIKHLTPLPTLIECLLCLEERDVEYKTV